MEEVDPLDIHYEDHGGVRELVAGTRYCLEEISLGFDRWGSPTSRAPGST